MSKLTSTGYLLPLPTLQSTLIIYSYFAANEVTQPCHIPAGPASLLGALLLLAPAVSHADRLWTLQLEGGSVVLALDRPEERGATVVFHRHPDAVFSSLRTKDVVRITSADGPTKKPRKSIEGQMLVLGRDADPPEQIADAAPPVSPDAYANSEPPYAEVGYGYGYGSGRPHRPRPGHPVPTNIGPNGYPILNPTFPGAQPPPIGSNGFPILAPTPPPIAFQPPPRPQPRRASL